MRDIRKRLEELIKKIEISEIQETLEHILEKRPKNVVESFLEGVGFGKGFCNHPLIGKTINWGYFS